MSAATDARVSPRAWLGGYVSERHFLEKYPYYAAVLARLEPVADPTVRSMAVELHRGKFYLRINPAFFAERPQYLTGILLHEVHHIVLGHLTDEGLQSAEHRDYMELAMEMAANEYIDEPLPDPIRWEDFAKRGLSFLRAGQSTRERYELLVAIAPRIPSPTPSTCDDHEPWFDEESAGSKAPPNADEHARKLVSDAIASAETTDPLPEPFAPLPKRLRLAGKHPARLVEALAHALGPPRARLDWARALAELAAKVRAPRHTYSRPARRFPELVGVLPGRAYAPRTTERPHVLCVIDTSASMTRGELEEIARQLAVLSPRARVTVAECDASIARVYPFTGALPAVVGRGGTDLRPVFEPGFLATVRPDGLVYFTDGEGPFPERPPAIPVLWVLTRDGHFACPWGLRAALRA